jgi:hypothetical protein
MHAWVLEDFEETSAIFVDCQSVEEMKDHQDVACDMNEDLVQPKKDDSKIVCGQSKRVKWKIIDAIRDHWRPCEGRFAEGTYFLSHPK